MTRARGVLSVLAPAVVLAAVVGVAPAAVTAPGQIDATFGHLRNGTVLLGVDMHDSIARVLRQNDGKVVTAGHTDGTAFLTRHTANGALDATFSGDGVFTASHIGDAVLQLDGKFVFTGTSSLTRLRTNGTVDPTLHPVAYRAPSGAVTLVHRLSLIAGSVRSELRFGQPLGWGVAQASAA
jgi:hypothetical protein